MFRVFLWNLGSFEVTFSDILMVWGSSFEVFGPRGGPGVVFTQKPKIWLLSRGSILEHLGALGSILGSISESKIDTFLVIFSTCFLIRFLVDF